jgi:hypothetical protein
MEEGRTSVATRTAFNTLVSPAEQRQLSSAIYGDSSDREIRAVDLIRGESIVADGASIYLIDNEYVLLHAPPAFPDAVSAQAEAMTAMSGRVSRDARRAILPIVASGWLDNRSYLVMPWCIPLRRGRISGRLDRMRISRDVLAWIRSMTECCVPEQSPDAAAEFDDSLGALVDMPELSAPIRNEAKRLRTAIASGALRPAHVPMHGDLWQGNILRRQNGSLAVIDWGGSTTNGYAIYDLIRFAQSFRLSKASLRRELRWHSAKLDRSVDGSSAHLLGALGHYALRLGEFPRERFCVMAEECWNTFKSAL